MTLKNGTIQSKYILQKKFNIQKLNPAFYRKPGETLRLTALQEKNASRVETIHGSNTRGKHARHALPGERVTRVAKISIACQALGVA